MGKIRLRHGDSEIELEGDEGFIERQLANFYARFKIDVTSRRKHPELLDSEGTREGADKGLTPAEYLKAHANLNVNGVMQLLLLGRYLQDIRDKRQFAPKEVNELSREAKLPKDIHPQRYADAVEAGFLRLDNGRYSLTGTAEEVLKNPSQPERKSARAVTQPSRERKSGAKNRTKSVELEKFDPHKSEQQAGLEDFLAEKKPESAAEWLAVVAYYIMKIKGAPSFSEGNIDYAYRILKRTDRPVHLRQILINNKNKNDLFDFAPDGVRWILTRTGEILVENKLPPRPK